MSHRGRGDDGAVGVLSYLFERSEGRAATGRRCFSRTSRIDVENSGEGGVFRLVNDAEVIAAERSRADDCNAGRGVNSRDLPV
jgi:hypothetical protein